MTLSKSQHIVIEDFNNLRSQLSALDFVDSAIAIFDTNKNLVFGNSAFEKINRELRDLPDSFDTVSSLCACPGFMEALDNAFNNKAQTFYIQRFYYSKNIHVDISLCFKPVYDTSLTTIHGMMYTIGEESIDFNNKYLAKLQDKLASTKDRIKRLEKEKYNSEVLVRHLFKNAPFAMVLLNSDRTVLHINKHAEKLFGVNSIDMVGKPCNTILSCYESCNGCPLQEGIHQKIELDEIAGTDSLNNSIPLLRSGVQFHNMDSDIILEAFIDLREIRKAQQENKAKSSFLANMTHEIRTPLTSILGYSEMLLDSKQSQDERTNSIHTIIRSGRHLQQLINNILDISKIEAERLDLERIDVSPFELMSEICSISMSKAKAKGLECHLNYKFPLPKFINSDPVRLRQILINLCGNAIKFTHEGQVCVEVSYSQLEEKLFFKVTDTGIGMTDEQMLKIFDDFTQADSSTTRQYGGSGLGLHLSKQLANLLGGDIIVNSEIDKGSCFTLSVSVGEVTPLKLVDTKPDVSTSIAPASPILNDDIVSGRVLLAEDNIDNQELISIYINNAGAEVDIAENGLEAVTMAMKQAYDLIIMDMQMPVMDGMEAAKTLRARGYEGPIVALTANAFHEFADKCKDAGCCAFLSKPVDRQRFYQVLYKYLGPQTDNIDPLHSSLLEEEPELIGLIEKYIKKYPTMIEELKHAFESEDWELFAKQLHDLKATGGNYGFMDVTHLTIRIKDLLDDEDHLAIPGFIQELEKLHPRMLLATPGLS